MLTIKVHFDGKVIVPDEPVDLPCGRPLLVHVEEPQSDGEVETDSALEWLQDAAIHDESVPSDLADQHDHYLYGAAKDQG